MPRLDMGDYGRLSGDERAAVDAWVTAHGVPLNQCFGLDWRNGIARAWLYCVDHKDRFVPIGDQGASYIVKFGYQTPPLGGER